MKKNLEAKVKGCYHLENSVIWNPEKGFEKGCVIWEKIKFFFFIQFVFGGTNDLRSVSIIMKARKRGA